MNRKSKGMGLGIASGAALGVILGFWRRACALWLGIGVAIGDGLGQHSAAHDLRSLRSGNTKSRSQLEARN